MSDNRKPTLLELEENKRLNEIARNEWQAKLAAEKAKVEQNRLLNEQLEAKQKAMNNDVETERGKMSDDARRLYNQM
jgi:hypothetical protein